MEFFRSYSEKEKIKIAMVTTAAIVFFFGWVFALVSYSNAVRTTGDASVADTCGTSGEVCNPQTQYCDVLANECKIKKKNNNVCLRNNECISGTCQGQCCNAGTSGNCELGSTQCQNGNKVECVAVELGGNISGGLQCESCGGCRGYYKNVGTCTDGGSDDSTPPTPPTPPVKKGIVVQGKVTCLENGRTNFVKGATVKLAVQDSTKPAVTVKTGTNGNFSLKMDNIKDVHKFNVKVTDKGGNNAQMVGPTAANCSNAAKTGCQNANSCGEGNSTYDGCKLKANDKVYNNFDFQFTNCKVPERDGDADTTDDSDGSEDGSDRADNSDGSTNSTGNATGSTPTQPGGSTGNGGTTSGTTTGSTSTPGNRDNGISSVLEFSKQSPLLSIILLILFIAAAIYDYMLIKQVTFSEILRKYRLTV